MRLRQKVEDFLVPTKILVEFNKKILEENAERIKFSVQKFDTKG